MRNIQIQLLEYLSNFGNQWPYVTKGHAFPHNVEINRPLVIDLSLDHQSKTIGNSKHPTVAYVEKCCFCTGKRTPVVSPKWTLNPAPIIADLDPL